MLLKKPMAKRIFPEGKDAKGRDYNDLRWSRFKNFSPAEMVEVVSDDRDGLKMVHRDPEEALDLRRMQIHGQHAIGPGRLKQVGH